MMATETVWRVLFTKHLVKKKKTYHDGFLLLSNGSDGLLLDEEGKRLGTARIPSASLPISTDTAGLDCFEGFLVDSDAQCRPEDLPNRSWTSNKENGTSAPVATAPEATSRVHLPARAFKAVRPVVQVKVAAEEPRAARQPVLLRRPSSQPAVPPEQTVQVRSDEEVLRLFCTAGASVPYSPADPVSKQNRPGLTDLPSNEQPHAGNAASPALAVAESRWSSDMPDDRDPLAEAGRELLTAIADCDEAQPEASTGDGRHSRLAANLPAWEKESGAQIAVKQPSNEVQAAAQHWTGNNENIASTSGIAEEAEKPLLAREPAAPSIPHIQAPAKRRRVDVMPNTAWKPPERANAHVAMGRESRAECTDVAGLSGLSFPSAVECERPQRTRAVPDAFSSVDEYKAAWEPALAEELNLRLGEVAKRFHKVLQQCPSSRAAPGGPEMQKAMRTGKVLYYGSCELNVYPAKRDGGSPQGSSSVFLTLKSGLEPSKDFRKDDIWVVSSSPVFQSAPKKGAVGDRLNQPWTALARSCWHGPNKDGRMQMEWLTKEPPNLRRSQSVFAIHGPEASTELAMLGAIGSLGKDTLPVLPAMLQRPQDPGHLEVSEGSSPVAEDVRQVAQQFSLNEDQTEALRSTFPWFCTSPDDQGTGTLSPLCIIHGPFGSGKSSTLIAMIHFFVKQLAKQATSSTSARVLVAAHANIAVDRVLTGLLDTGFTDLLRIGPLRRMDKRLLPYSLHCCQAKGSGDATSELNDMLRTCTSASKSAIIRQELAEVKAGAERKRRKLLKSVRVVGVTCCSSSLPLMDDMAMDVCVLDECSQIVEPLSLLPLLRAKCRFLVVAGDPCQLPPLITSPSMLTTRPQTLNHEPYGPTHGLARPLFSRLLAMGYPSHLLRIQYRCHPALSDIPNQHFYQGRLLDGCSADDRKPLVAGVPVLACINAPGTCQSDPYSQSCSNRAEASAIAMMARRLLRAGVSSDQIGIICFFRAQVALVSSLLNASLANREKGEEASAIDVATVDSFQGMEKDIIILTVTVSRGVFASDLQRLNVALTRARRHLFIVSDVYALPSLAPAFAALVEKCRGFGSIMYPAEFCPEALPQCKS